MSPPSLRTGDLRTIARLSFSCSQFQDDDISSRTIFLEMPRSLIQAGPNMLYIPSQSKRKTLGYTISLGQATAVMLENGWRLAR